MYIMKNALRNIQRSKGRSILFAAIVFIIALSACLSLSIRAAAETTRAQGLEQLAITGNITLDMDEIMGEKNGEPPDRSEMKKSMQDSELSLEELQKYAKLDSVKSFWYTGSVSVDASKIEAVSTSEGGMGGRMMGGAMGQADGDFTITGYSSDEAMTDFTDGNAEITDGVMFEEGTSEKNCVISSTLAKYNDLEVGDSIKFVSPSDTSKTFKVKIVGIYSSGSSSQGGMGDPMGIGNSNNIYMSYAALSAIADSTGLDMRTQGTYSFADYDAYSKFEDQAHEAGLDSKYTVQSQDINNYERQLQPLENLSRYAKYFLIILLIIGGAVLMALTMFSIRERKYEVGVLAAIGMSKKKIARQFIYEIAVISIAAIILGGLLGSLTSVPVTNKLLSASAATTTDSFDRGGPGGGQVPDGGQMGPGQDQSNDQSTDSRDQSTDQSTDTSTDQVTNDSSSDLQITQTASTSSVDGSQSDSTNDDSAAAAKTLDGERGGPGMRDYVDSVTSAANLKVIAELVLVGLLLIAVSAGAALSQVLRYDPLSILTSRD